MTKHPLQPCAPSFMPSSFLSFFCALNSSQASPAGAAPGLLSLSMYRGRDSANTSAQALGSGRAESRRRLPHSACTPAPWQQQPSLGPASLCTRESQPLCTAGTSHLFFALFTLSTNGAGEAAPCLPVLLESCWTRRFWFHIQQHGSPKGRCNTASHGTDLPRSTQHRHKQWQHRVSQDTQGRG